MPINTCSFIRETGRQCGSPAMRGQDRCFYHERDHLRRQILATWRVGGNAHLLASMALPPLDTPEEVQICINALFHAMTENKISEESRKTFVDILRLASRNLRAAAIIRHLELKAARAAQQQQQQEPATVRSAEEPFSETTQAGTLASPAPSPEDFPPQDTDAELHTQLKSAQDDKLAVQTLLRGSLKVIPKKPVDKEVIKGVSSETADR